MFPYSIHCTCFNTQPPEGGWNVNAIPTKKKAVFQHTAARRRLGLNHNKLFYFHYVSTHSRPKAAGRPDYLVFREMLFQHTAARRRLEMATKQTPVTHCFNTQPPEGGWEATPRSREGAGVSTHSRPKAAGRCCFEHFTKGVVSTHSRPKAAGYWCAFTD